MPIPSREQVVTELRILLEEWELALRSGNRGQQRIAEQAIDGMNTILDVIVREPLADLFP
jgi:hypothetical protein